MNIPRAIEKVVKWCGREASRYTLACVRLGRRSGKCYAEATDGRRLVLLEWDEKGDDLDCILDGKELAKACRAVKGRRPIPMADNPNGTAHVGASQLQTIDGRWPTTEELFYAERIGNLTQDFTPQRLRELANQTRLKVGGQEVLVNSQYLVDLADQADAVGAGTVTVKVSDPQSQVVCEGEGKGGVNMTAVIMPLAAD